MFSCSHTACGGVLSSQVDFCFYKAQQVHHLEKHTIDISFSCILNIPGVKNPEYTPFTEMLLIWCVWAVSWFYGHMMLLKLKWSSYSDHGHKTTPAALNINTSPDACNRSSLSKYNFKSVFKATYSPCSSCINYTSSSACWSLAAGHEESWDWIRWVK